MADETTVEELAKQTNVDVETLIAQLQSAKVKVKSKNDFVSAEEKADLLAKLRELHGKKSVAKNTIKLDRKKTKTVSVPGSRGKRTVKVVVKKTRTVDLKSKIKKDEVEEKPSIVEDEVDKEKLLTQVSTEDDTGKEKEEKIVSDKIVDSEKSAKDTKKKEEYKDAIEVADVKKASDDSRKHSKKSKKSSKYDEEQSDKKGRGKSKQSAKRKYKEYATGLDEEEEFRGAKKRAKAKAKKSQKELEEITSKHAFEKPTEPIVREVLVSETITVGEIAEKLSIKAAEVIKALMQSGIMATINQILDQDTACLIIEELGHKAKPIKETTVEEGIKIEYTANKENRWPVVTIMGHVDHGKTSLLDYIRSTRVVAAESGGITQHIGAYTVKTDHGNMTFLDTPGHAAFTAMRARGAKCTDIVILVVAADDGVKPQTIEAIQHAKAADVPIIVAINKIDKPEIDLDKVISELSKYELIPESWGGETQFINISAKVGTGIDGLLEAVLLQAEMLDLKAVFSGPAQGIVIESKLDKGRGPVATILIQNGILKNGNMVLAGMEFGRIRCMISDLGEKIDTAGPSQPVEILGLSGIPNAGDEFLVVENEQKAREVAAYRYHKYREIKLAKQQASKLEGFMDRMKQKSDKEVKGLNILLKADVQGSLEALRDSLLELSNDEIKINIISSGVGGFNESDINLVMASTAALIGFNVRADATARKLALREGIKLNYFSVIYDVIDWVKAAIEGKLGPKFEEKIIGIAEVRDVFKSPKLGAIAGCMVTDGLIKRGNPIRVLRDNVVIYEGELESLRRFKDDVNEVRKGTECGIGVKNYNDVKVKDQIEVYERVEVARNLT